MKSILPLIKLTCLMLFLGSIVPILSVSEASSKDNVGSIPGVSESRKCHSSDPSTLIKRSYDFSDFNTADFPIELSTQVFNLASYSASLPHDAVKSPENTTLKRAPEGGPIVLRLNRPDNISPDDWQRSYLNGFAGNALPNGQLENLRKMQMTVREKTAQMMVIDAVMPFNIDAYKDSNWTFIPVLCGGAENKVLGYASALVRSVSVKTSWVLAIAGILIFWSVISIASYQLNKSRLQNLWNNGGGIFKTLHGQSRYAEYAYKAFEASNPIFISQDSLGFGSLARFQILIFTTVVGFVLLFVFIHSGFISGVSDTVLLLLGVTVVGGTLARASGDWIGIAPDTRRWLVTSGALVFQRDKPRWSDLLETQGEVDVAKVQALLFTALISFGIFASGYTGLSNFNLPEQTVYLAILSQGTYVFGKLLPADTRKRVQEDVSAMRVAASKLVLNPNNAQLQLGYDEAKRAAKQTLEQTYMERFHLNSFQKATHDPLNLV